MSQPSTSDGQSVAGSASATLFTELISFRIDWFELLLVPGTLKSLLQHHNSRASILQHSTFSMVQLADPYKATGKTIA